MTFNTRALGIQAGWLLKESGWKEGMDRNLIVLSALARGVIEAADITDYPTAPLDGFKPGDMYTIATSAEGWGHPDMETHRRELLIRTESGWEFMVPDVGLVLRDSVSFSWYTYTGGYYGWVVTERPGNNIHIFIDMANDDYLMNKTQAEAPTKTVFNAAAGKALIWPTDSDLSIPAMQTVIALYSEPGFLLRQQTTGADALVPASSYVLSVVSPPEPGTGLTIINQIDINGRTINPLGDSVGALDNGCILYSVGDDDVDLQIPLENIVDHGFNFKVIQTGLGKVTFIPAIGVTLLHPDGHGRTKGPGAVVDFHGGGSNEFVVFTGSTEVVV